VTGSTRVDLVPVTDVLLREPALPYRCMLRILGIATRFETNSRHVVGIVDETFGACREVDELPTPGLEDGAHVRIIVREGSEHVDPVDGQVPVTHICPDAQRVIAHSPGSVALSDPGRGEAVLYVSTEMVVNRERFRSAMLEAMTLSLLSHFDRHPLHAAAVGRAGSAVLLAGPSGTGKSTLAYAAHRAGLDVISEDHIWIQRQPVLRVWGWPGSVRLTAGATVHFPGVERLGIRSFVNGKEKLAVDVSGAAATNRRPVRSAIVCLLDRGEGPVSLRRVDHAALAGALSQQLAPGFDRFPERHHATMAALCAGGGWRLRLSPNPADAVPCLLHMLDDVAERVSPPAPPASSASPT
jgi:hypothetical protein